MADTEALANWTLESLWQQMQGLMTAEIETVETLAESMFDEDIEGRGAVGNRLYLSSPVDTTPCIFFEQSPGHELDIVVEWDDEEAFRDSVPGPLRDQIRKYFEA